MARSRNIKPGFFKNARLAECSVWARLVFPGLWMLADRAGRLEDRPKQIRGELLPYDDEAPPMDTLLQELHDGEFILRYQVDGKKYIQVMAFSKHQTPHYSEKHGEIIGPVLQESGGHQRTEFPEPSGKQGGIKPPLQEIMGHEAGGFPESSGKEGGLKRGSGPPDCGFLIPDSRFLKPEKTSAGSEWVACGQLVEDGLDLELAEDWLAHRKRRRAPLTPRAWQSMKDEAEKASWSIVDAVSKAIHRNWVTFDAQFVANAKPSTDAAASDQWRRSNEGIARMGRETGIATRQGESFASYADRITAHLRTEQRSTGKTIP